MPHTREITANNISDLTKDSQDQIFYDVHPSRSSESLLTVLDDKNRLIATLRKQLQNQKLQLSYYLKKELTPAKMSKLSQSCSPAAPEESMAVKLAMTHFNRQMGIKSNVICLYDRMSYIDERIANTLQDQEYLLRKIVNKLYEFVKQAHGNVEVIQFCNFLTDPFHLELFNKLLSSTLNLKKKLDIFRICCNRLLVVEDERNNIVEQIYAMPAEERINCNYLVSIQSEKLQLENELQQVIKEQRRDQDRIKELNLIEEKLSNLQLQLNSAIFHNDDGFHIRKMLQEVNSEAKVLLELTKRQRRKFEIKMAQMKETNISLERILSYVKLALGNTKPNTTELLAHGIATVDDFKIFECIKKEIDIFKENSKSKLFDEIQSKEWDNELLHNRLHQVLYERNDLRLMNAKLKKTISEMKFNQDMDLAALKEERDMYKRQVGDLEAIREAYAQLVHKQPAASIMEKEYLEQIKDQEEQIYDLEKTNRDLTMELKSLKNIINKQSREIKQQTKVLEELKQHGNVNVSHDKNLECVYKNKNTEIYGSLKDIRELPENPDTLSYVGLYQQEIYVQEKLVNWIEDVGDQTTKCIATNSIIPGSERMENNDNKCKSAIYSSRRLSNSDSNRKDDRRDSKRSTTCVKVISSKRSSDVTETIVRTTVEGDLQSNSERTNSPAFRLEFNANSNTGEGRRTTEYDKFDINEYELMKDCSHESIPRVCHLRKKQYQQRFQVINDQVEY